jgi:hypothetical protein
MIGLMIMHYSVAQGVIEVDNLTNRIAVNQVQNGKLHCKSKQRTKERSRGMPLHHQ